MHFRAFWCIVWAPNGPKTERPTGHMRCTPDGQSSAWMLFYRANMESIVRYGITTWFGNLSVKLKSQLQNLIKRAGKIIGMQPPCSLQEICERTVMKQSLKITRDTSHILHREFEVLPSGRRYREPNCRLNRFKFSFVPLAIKALNDR